MPTLETTTTDFIDHADANYTRGARSAQRDVDQLQLIADYFRDVLSNTEAMFAKLDVARDVLGYQGGIRITSHSNWDREQIAEKLVDAFASELLSDRAGMVLRMMIKTGVE